MQEEIKYDLSDFTPEAEAAFMADFAALTEKHEAYFEPVPVFIQDPKDSTWRVAVSVKLLKKTKVEDKQETQDDSAADAA